MVHGKLRELGFRQCDSESVLLNTTIKTGNKAYRDDEPFYFEMNLLILHKCSIF